LISKSLDKSIFADGGGADLKKELQTPYIDAVNVDRRLLPVRRKSIFSNFVKQ
jgi:hypothetical protein